MQNRPELAQASHEQLITNPRGTRAFHKTTGRIVCHRNRSASPSLSRMLTLLIAVGAFGVLSVAAQAAAVHPGKAVASRVHHRSVWAVRWAQQHPAQEAAYQHRFAAKHVRYKVHASPWAAAHPWTAGMKGRHHGRRGRWMRQAAKPWAPVNERVTPGTTHPAVIPVAPATTAAAAPMTADAAAPANGVKVALAPTADQIRILPNVQVMPSGQTPPAAAIAAVAPQPIQTAVQPAAPAPTRAPIRVAKAPSPMRVAEDGDAAEQGDTTPQVTLDFVAADINDVLKSLAMQTHTNIVSGTDVKGNVTVSLTHVYLDEALDLITKLSGYQYAKVGRTYVVGSPTSIQSLTASGTASVPPTTAVLSFMYSDPNDLTSTIKDRYPNVKATPGKGVSGGGGVLIVTGTDADVAQVKMLISDSEAALSRGISASRTTVYNIKYASAQDLTDVLNRLVPSLVVTPGPTQGFSLKAPITADMTATTSTTSTGASAMPPTNSMTSGTIATKPTTYSLLLTGNDADVERGLALLNQVDLQPSQIVYEAKITEMNPTSSKKIGLNWDFSNASTTIGELLPFGVKPTDPVLPAPYPGNITKFGVIGRTPAFQLATVTLDGLFKDGSAKLLSDPNISAVDGQPAAVFIGDTIYYISSISNANGQQTVTTSSVNVGIKLYVTGKVNNDGYITLNIHPEVSTISGFLNVPGGGQLPQIANREATTTVRVKDGETIAIGGLISQNDVKNVQKVPFFGDLPFFGQLFRDTTTTHGRDEVVIFVKVSIQKNAA